jgi:hypothetical protein
LHMCPPLPCPSMLERPRAHSQRHAHCPLCGEEQVAGLVSEIGNAEDALCSDRCAAAWHALTVVRRCESLNEALATRRRLELGAGQQHAPTLSELLLERWRAGDWSVAPEDLLSRL